MTRRGDNQTEKQSDGRDNNNDVKNRYCEIEEENGKEEKIIQRELRTTLKVIEGRTTTKDWCK
jgi:hypothetical protein